MKMPGKGACCFYSQRTIFHPSHKKQEAPKDSELGDRNRRTHPMNPAENNVRDGLPASQTLKKLWNHANPPRRQCVEIVCKQARGLKRLF
jgi:hypothetical protein